MTGVKPRAIGFRPLRRVGWRDPETGKDYVFLTNAGHLAARTIAEVYKARWQIELFFKWLKQNLRITTFLGTSRNAVLTQIWVAICVYLMLAYLKFASRTGRSLQEILRLLHLNLFQRRDLATLLARHDRDPEPKWQQKSTGSPLSPAVGQQWSATVYRFVVARWWGFRLVPSRSMALRITRSLRMAAVSASLGALPLARRR